MAKLKASYCKSIKSPQVRRKAKVFDHDHVNNEQIEIHFEVPNGMYKLLENIVYNIK